MAFSALIRNSVGLPTIADPKDLMHSSVESPTNEISEKEKNNHKCKKKGMTVNGDLIVTNFI